jgi:hypothetical protein
VILDRLQHGFFFDVAIDGDVVLASAQRAINTNDDRINGVYIFQRAPDGRWNYSSPLTEGSQTLESVQFSGNVAVTYALFNTGSFRIFERGAAGWSQTATITVAAQPFRVEDGSIFTRPNAPGNGQCPAPLNQYRKVNGTWQVIATIGGTRCDQDFPDFNDGRAVIVSRTASGSPLPIVPIYRNVNGAWPQVASIDQPPPQENSPALSLGTLGNVCLNRSRGRTDSRHRFGNMFHAAQSAPSACVRNDETEKYGAAPDHEKLLRQSIEQVHGSLVGQSKVNGSTELPIFGDHSEGRGLAVDP